MPLRMEVGLGSDDSVVPALPTERGTAAPHRDRLFFRADIRFDSCIGRKNYRLVISALFNSLANDIFRPTK